MDIGEFAELYGSRWPQGMLRRIIDAGIDTAQELVYSREEMWGKEVEDKGFGLSAGETAKLSMALDLWGEGRNHVGQAIERPHMFSDGLLPEDGGDFDDESENEGSTDNDE